MDEPWEITVVELKRLIDSGTRVNLIDVRERHEYDLCRIIGSRLVPLALIPMTLKELNPSEEYILYCHTGIRSAAAVNYLRLPGFGKAKNLIGGIDQWAAEIDFSMPRY
jgi:adenylyltransferase/sulfurtransferase